MGKSFEFFNHSQIPLCISGKAIVSCLLREREPRLTALSVSAWSLQKYTVILFTRLVTGPQEYALRFEALCSS